MSGGWYDDARCGLGMVRAALAGGDAAAIRAAAGDRDPAALAVALAQLLAIDIRRHTYLGPQGAAGRYLRALADGIDGAEAMNRPAAYAKAAERDDG